VTGSMRVGVRGAVICRFVMASCVRFRSVAWLAQNGGSNLDARTSLPTYERPLVRCSLGWLFCVAFKRRLLFSRVVYVFAL